MSDMKCPFCQQELDCMGKYTDGSSKWLCNKCDLFGDKKLFDEIIAQADKAERLQKAVGLIADMEQRLCIDDPVDILDDVLKIAKDEIKQMIKETTNDK